MSRLAVIQRARPIRVPTFVGAADTELPVDWPVYNAPRPLFGQIAWKGECCHGVYYAALDPALREFQTLVARNLALDAWPVEWVSEEEARAWLKQFGKNVPNFGIKVDRAASGSIWSMYIRLREEAARVEQGA